MYVIFFSDDGRGLHRLSRLKASDTIQKCTPSFSAIALVVIFSARNLRIALSCGCGPGVFLGIMAPSMGSGAVTARGVVWCFSELASSVGGIGTIEAVRAPCGRNANACQCLLPKT